MRFHDGRTLTSRDVAYSLRRAAGPQVTGELFTVTFHNYLAGMELEAADERTIRLKTPEPMADLPELLRDMVIRSPPGLDPNFVQSLICLPASSVG